MSFGITAAAIGVGTAASIGMGMAGQSAQQDAINKAQGQTQQGYNTASGAVQSGVYNANALLNPYAAAGGSALTAFQGSLGLSQPRPPDRNQFIKRTNPAREMAASGQAVNPQIIAYFDQNPQTSFDQAAYDQAMQQYQTDLQNWQGNNQQYQEEQNSINQYIKNAADPFTLDKYKQEANYTPFVNTLEELQATPGYQFRLKQGLQALDNSASSRGMQLSGAQQQAITNYGQDYASNEYQNAWNRAQQAYNQAVQNNMERNAFGYNSVNQQRQNRMGNYQSLMNMGANAAGQQSQNIMGGAGLQANLATGNAQSQSKLSMAQGQSKADMYDSMGTAVNKGIEGGLGAYLYMKNPKNGMNTPPQAPQGTVFGYPIS